VEGEGMRRLAATVLSAVVLLGAGGEARAVASPGSATTAIVSLGDSFISGEGGRWLGNGSEPLGTRSGTDRAAYDCDALGLCEYDPTRVYGASEENDCHRSDVAPIRSAPVAAADKVNLACSGARLANVWPAAMGGRSHFGEAPQADQLAPLAERDDVRMVILTAGANDVGFGELVAGCALDWARSPEGDPILCRGSAQDDVDAALPVMEEGLEKALRGVRGTMVAAGYRRSDYRLVTMGYASPFPAGRWFRYPEDGWSRLNEGGCPVWNADADWAAGAGIGSIVAAMRRAAAATGAEFLDLRHALDGHQLCDHRSRRVGPAGPSPEASEWVRRLAFVQGSSRESLHPNAYGQRAIGACLGLLYVAPRGDYACHDEPRHSYVDGMSIEPTD
jgi:GDSL-like Lipase/Acylhydrolase family